MTRAQLEHVVRAAADIADDDEIVVVGSQAILGEHPDAPKALCVSVEADVYPKNRPERWNVIDGAIGEGSPFHGTFGYYAQGVEEGTVTLPEHWKDRLVVVWNQATRFAKGLCLETHDLVLSKYVAGREKRRFIRAAIDAGYLERDVLRARLATKPRGDPRPLRHSRFRGPQPSHLRHPRQQVPPRRRREVRPPLLRLRSLHRNAGRVRPSRRRYRVELRPMRGASRASERCRALALLC